MNTFDSNGVRIVCNARLIAGDIIRLMDHLKIEKADLFGYSMGGRNAGWMLSQHQDRFSSVVIGGGGIPVMVIAGSRDSVSGSSIPLAEAIPHAQAVLVPNKSHLSVIISKFFYGAVLGFLGQVWQDDLRHSWIDC